MIKKSLFLLLIMVALSSYAQEYRSDFLVVSAQYISKKVMTESEQKNYCYYFECDEDDTFYNVTYRVIENFTKQKKSPTIVKLSVDCNQCYNEKYSLLFIVQSKMNYLFDLAPIYRTKNKKWATCYSGILDDLDIYADELENISFFPLVKYPLMDATEVLKQSILEEGIFTIDNNIYFASKGLYVDDYFEKKFQNVLENYDMDIEMNLIKHPFE